MLKLNAEGRSPVEMPLAIAWFHSKSLSTHSVFFENFPVQVDAQPRFLRHGDHSVDHWNRLTHQIVD